MALLLPVTLLGLSACGGNDSDEDDNPVLATSVREVIIDQKESKALMARGKNEGVIKTPPTTPDKILVNTEEVREAVANRVDDSIDASEPGDTGEENDAPDMSDGPAENGDAPVGEKEQE